MIRKILLVILILLILISYTTAFLLSDLTILPLWIPLSASILITALSGIFLWKSWRSFTRIRTFAVNYACHCVVATGLLLCAFFSLNTILANKDSLHEEKCTVTRKFVEERHHSRRVGRGRYVRGEPYNVYFFEVRFPDGKTKKFETTFTHYRRVRINDTVTLSMVKGLFGIPVVRRDRKYLAKPD